MNSGVGMSSYLILLLKAIAFSKMTKSYHVNKILEPSYIGFFPWVYPSVVIHEPGVHVHVHVYVQFDWPIFG